MNTTETRLKDALRSVADSLDAADVPELALAGRTPRRLRSAALALGAVAAAVATAATFALNPTGSRPASPAAATRPGRADLIVYLCVAGSPNPSCGYRDATVEEMSVVADALRRLPAKKVFFFVKKEATRECHADGRPAPWDGNGDPPDCFRVTLDHPADAPREAEMIIGMPGVDRVETWHTG